MQSLALKRFHMLIPGLLDRFRYAGLASVLCTRRAPFCQATRGFRWRYGPMPLEGLDRISSKESARKGNRWRICRSAYRATAEGTPPPKTVNRRLNSSSGWSSGSGRRDARGPWSVVRGPGRAVATRVGSRPNTPFLNLFTRICRTASTTCGPRTTDHGSRATALHSP
jgi:hypothetical protein